VGHLYITTEAETLAGLQRFDCSEPHRTGILGHIQTVVAWDMNEESVFVKGIDKIIPNYSFHKPFTIILPHQGEWEGAFQPDRKWGLI
jgi:hypothetical protein